MKGRDKRGFTLTELLLVIAIISVLTVISVPVFGSAVVGSREAACLENRNSLKSALSATYLLSEGSNATAKAAVEAEFQARKQLFPCPSGGTISYMIAADGSILVSCSIHNGNAGTMLKDALNNSGVSLGNKKRIDSASPNGTMISKIKKALSDAGLDVSALGAKTWLMINNTDSKYENTQDPLGRQIVWTDQDVQGLKPGIQKVRVICYNVDHDSYYVGYSNVQIDSTRTYNIIGRSAEANGYGSDAANAKQGPFATYQEAYAIFATETPVSNVK